MVPNCKKKSNYDLLYDGEINEQEMATLSKPYTNYRFLLLTTSYAGYNDPDFTGSLIGNVTPGDSDIYFSKIWSNYINETTNRLQIHSTTIKFNKNLLDFKVYSSFYRYINEDNAPIMKTCVRKIYGMK